MIRVVIAEGQVPMRGVLSGSLEMEPDIEVVAQVEDGRAALAALVVHEPDVLVTEAELPNMTGAELAAVAQHNHPGVRVLVLEAATYSAYLRHAQLADAIRAVAAPVAMRRPPTPEQ